MTAMATISAMAIWNSEVRGDHLVHTRMAPRLCSIVPLPHRRLTVRSSLELGSGYGSVASGMVGAATVWVFVREHLVLHLPGGPHRRPRHWERFGLATVLSIESIRRSASGPSHVI